MILHPLPPALQLQLQSQPQFVAAKSLIPVPPKIIYNASYVGLHVTVSDFFEKFAESFSDGSRQVQPCLNFGSTVLV